MTKTFEQRGKPEEEYKAFSIQFEGGDTLDLECENESTRDGWVNALRHYVKLKSREAKGIAIPSKPSRSRANTPPGGTPPRNTPPSPRNTPPSRKTHRKYAMSTMTKPSLPAARPDS